MKLSKTQQKLIDEAKRDIAVMSKYKDFADFFEHSKFEQNYMTTAAHCNGAYNSVEKYMQKDIDRWRRMEASYKKAVEEHIIIVFAKTETIDALERAGAIKIIKRADYKGAAETIKIL